jgi:integrase
MAFQPHSRGLSTLCSRVLFHSISLKFVNDNFALVVYPAFIRETRPCRDHGRTAPPPSRPADASSPSCSCAGSRPRLLPSRHGIPTNGLALRVQPSGQRSFKAVYSYRGQARWFHIGSADAIGLADARKIAAKVMLEVATGKDPLAERRAERGAGTFAELAERYVEQHAKKKNRSWRQAEALVRKNLLPRWGRLEAKSITRSDVRAAMGRIKAPIVANQTLAAASAIFTWAANQEIIAVNPCRGVERNQTADRDRVLSDAEVSRFWSAFDTAGLMASSALKVILLTGQRPGEVRHMRREHVSDGWRTMPGAPDVNIGWPGTKNGATHRVWLPKAAQDIIAELTDDEATGFVFTGSRGNSINDLDVAMRDICNRIAAERATPHDLRRTHGTTITRLGFGREAMNRVQNHREGGIADVYANTPAPPGEGGWRLKFFRALIACPLGKGRLAMAIWDPHLTLEQTNSAESGTYLVATTWNPKFTYDQEVFIVSKFDNRGHAMSVGGMGSGLGAEGDSGWGVRGWAPTGILGWGEQFGVIGTLHHPADQSPESRLPESKPLPPGCGVCGSVAAGMGVHGETFADVSAGVWGSNEAPEGKWCYGVIGSVRSVKDHALTIPLDGSAGVLGMSSDGTGVVGTSNTVGAFGYGGVAGVVGLGKTGVYGQGTSNHGVVGLSTSKTKYGVLGLGQDAGMGVGGMSKWGYGTVGATNVGVGVYGISEATFGVRAQALKGPASIGLYADAPGAAAYFKGDVLVHGNVIIDQNHSLILGTPGNKNAAVAFPDGSQRLLCAIESPEAWFEDFGEAALAKGKVHVAFDPDFARTVDLRRYHVFLTPYGETNGLYVMRRTRRGFDVVERKQGRSSVRFSWRVVAKPKSAKHKRFAKMTARQMLRHVRAAAARASKAPKIDLALPPVNLDSRVRKTPKALKVPIPPKSLMKVPSPDERRAKSRSGKFLSPMNRM